MAESRNIIVGAAEVFITAGTSVDASPSAGYTAFQASLTASTVPTASALATGTSWRNVGFTMEGVEVSYEPDYGDVEVDQLLDSARLFKQSMRVTVNTTFAEATLENLLVAWGQQGASLASDVLDIEGGALGVEPPERGIVFVGPAPRDLSTGGRKERVYHLKRAIQTESTSHALRRNEATGLPTSFRVLPVYGNSGASSSYGRIADRAVS